MDLANGAHLYRNQVKNAIIAPDFEPYLLHRLSGSRSANQCGKRMDGASDISVTAKIYTHMVDEMFEQNRQRLAEFTKNKCKTI